MAKLPPSEAAGFADKIYTVTEEPLAYSAFLKMSGFDTQSSRTLAAKVGGRFVLRVRDGFGVCAVKTNKSSQNKELYIIFRGTTTENSGADILTDAHCGLTRSANGDLVHCGFNRTFNSMLPTIKDFINTYRQLNPTAVHVIGHSLGGAIALLAADWIKSLSTMPVYLYTFGAPRVGTFFFAKSSTQAIGSHNIHRVYHKTDPVPMVPIFPFAHPSSSDSAHYIESSQLVAGGTAHKMENYIFSVKSKSWSQLNAVPSSASNVDFAIQQWLETKVNYTTIHSPDFHKWAEAALKFVLRKLGLSLIASIQYTISGISTFVDLLAYIIHKQIDLSTEVSYWTILFIKRMMQAFGMRTTNSSKEITRDLIRNVLTRLVSSTNEAAKVAINNI